MVSRDAVDDGPKGENINFLNPSRHFASFSTGYWSIYDFGDSLFFPDLRGFSRDFILSLLQR
jgi:hypothetical protein